MTIINRKFKAMKILLVAVISVLILVCIPVFVRAATFQQKKAEWLSKDGWPNSNFPQPDLNLEAKPEEAGSLGDCWTGRTYIFAWLENGTHKQCDGDIRTWDCQEHVIRSFMDPNQPGCSFSDNSNIYRAPFLARVYFQYKDKISPGLYQEIGKQLRNLLFNRYAFSFGPFDDERTQQYISYLKYLIALENKDAEIMYRPCDDPKASYCYYQDFSDGGKTYEIGGVYNAYELMRAWLNAHWNFWLDYQVAEMDSPVYSISNLVAMITLYDFAGRPLERLGGKPDLDGLEMKKRAKMMTDFYLLDNGLQFGVSQRGSPMGRPKGFYFKGEDTFPFYQYFNSPSTRGLYTSADVVFVSTYQPSKLIYDLINLENEPDNYWRLEKEPRHGKLTYVTKYYTLGSSGGYDAWRMTIEPGENPSQPFALWINNEPYATNGGECLWLGESSHQYKNFMVIDNDTYCHSTSDTYCGFGGMDCEADKLKLHVFKPGHTFDEGEENLKPIKGLEWGYAYEIELDRWNFFREGKTMLAIKNYGNYGAFLEAGILGVDYQSFDDFKKAVEKNVKFVGDWNEGSDGLWYLVAQNSKGEKITIKKTARGDMNTFGPDGKDVHATQGRLETRDYKDDKVVSWQGKVMTVRYNGLQCVYDFEKWTYTGNGCEGGFDNYKHDLNCDRVVDVRDFGILLSHWRKTTGITKYKNTQCGQEKNLDFVTNGTVDQQDLAALLSCWGASTKEICLEK